MRPLLPFALLLSIVLPPAAAGPRPAPVPGTVVLGTNPLAGSRVVLEGAALERLTWNDGDAPAFPGDLPGSLTALYDASAGPGRVGWPLSGAFDQDDAFFAAAAFVIEPEGFSAPGLFQISWGLWNSGATGWNRTGSASNLAGDGFELIEWDYFPGRIFGGPFYSPSVFGAANPDSPLFEPLGSFANASFAFALAELPLGEPLLATIEHRPGDGAVVFGVFRITAAGGLLPVDGAVATVPLAALSLRRYAVDTFGLTLWQDGFGGETPALRAEVRFHLLVARPGLLSGPGGGVADVVRARP